MLDYGTGISRTMSPIDRAWAAVIWQKGKPPLDAELNLMSASEQERLRQYVAGLMPSGFLMDPTRAQLDFKFNKLWANHFHLGVPRGATGSLDANETQPIVWANVNGWIIPVAGTDITEAAAVHNVIKLYPPPGSDARTDFVFLEAWSSTVQPNPSTLNKPTVATIWKYGNVKHGGTNLTDDLEDPTVGSETTKRVQVQYRLRVYGSGLGGGAGVNLAVHPDGLGDPNILGQGANTTAPVAGMTWVNMRESLGDTSLWRAGDGDPNNALGTIDGYTYAIPICAVFRRNSQTYISAKAAGNAEQNGATLRTPGVSTLAGVVPLLQAELGAMLGPDDGKLANFTIAVTNLNGCGLEDTAHVLSGVFLRIDDEIVGISAVDLLGGTITIPAGGRGRWGTAAVGHLTGALITQFNTRPDGLYADEIASQDVLDLRRAVNPGDWDYTRLLTHNVAALAKGTLRTAWKESNPGVTEGPVVHEVCEMYAGGVDHPNQTDPVDGPDGIRTIWSDAATIQPDVTLLLDETATRDATGLVGFTNTGFDANVQWDVGADLKPIGFLNTGGLSAGWYNGSSVHLFIGGSTGVGGARGTFRDSGVEDVRFVTPQEFWKSGYPVANSNNGNQHPVTLRFLDEYLTTAPPAALPDVDRAGYPGPMYPWRESRFESPFIVLGGLLKSTLRIPAVNVSNLTSVADVGGYGITRHYLDLTGKGIDFDTDGVFYHKDLSGVFQNDPTAVSEPLLRGERTLYGMLTNNGQDISGASSEVYIVTFGDPTGRNNNGAFRVIGAGTAGYTEHSGSAAGMLVLEPLSADFTTWSATGSGNEITVDFRSQYHNADDVSSYPGRVADFMVVLTDIGGEGYDGSPWALNNLEPGLFLVRESGIGPYYSPSKMVLSTTLLYHPGRSATTRVPDEFVRFAMRGGSEETLGTYLRRAPSGIDTTFPVGTATDETYWPTVHIQTWNRLSGLGWHAPDAPAYGGAVVGFTEQDREHECFVDRGSKTVLFRPFRNRDMTLQALTWPVADCLLGSYDYPSTVNKDTLTILTGTANTGKKMGVEIPPEFMPRFGRQDIPYRQLNAGTVPTSAGFMPGINHLFTDVTDVTNPVFNFIGGERNAGGSEVNSLFLVTRASEIAYASTNATYGPKAVGAYGARKTTDLNPLAGQNTRDVIAALAAVNSSDLGRGLKGIQMPPYMGIARLYGVYEFDDYVAKGGTAFKSNRYEMELNPAINLLREDADQQSLFILRDGAKDLTEETGDHTYIIPSNVLDLTRVPTYVENVSVFEDFDYVVECTVFFFAKGFIDTCNIVLMRDRDGSFNQNVDGDDAEFENVPMCIPSPAGVNDRLYSAYNRTVYQGDPFMSRDGDTRQTADYENRYGRLSPSQANLLRTAVQQFDSAGDFMPQMANERAFEVLASMDFYTTLGTGKISGALFPGTSLDVGNIQADLLSATRMPLESTSNDWRIQVRSFTEGQKENSSRARATVEILSAQSMVQAHTYDDAFYVRFILLDGSVVTLYGSTAVFGATLVLAGVDPDDIFQEDEFSDITETVLAQEVVNLGIVSAGGIASVNVPMTFAAIGDGVILNPLTTPVAALFDATVTTPGFVTVRARNVYPAIPFDQLSDLQPIKTINVTQAEIGSVGAGSVTEVAKAFTGAQVGDVVVVNPPDIATMLTGFVVDGRVVAPDTIIITFRNQTTGALTLTPASINLDVAVLHETNLAAYDVDLSAAVFDIRLVKNSPSNKKTADGLVTCINANTKLQRTVTAYNDGTPKVTIEAVPTGAEGNGVRIEVGREKFGATIGTDPGLLLTSTFRLGIPFSNEPPVGHQTTATNLFGGVDLPVNAGNGTSQVALAGMTERLPLGVLVQDNDFLSENPLGDTSSAMTSWPAPLRPIQTLMPLTGGGEEYSRFMGAPGELVAMADVLVAPYSWAAWTDTAPVGATKKFRIYRGGGAAYVLSGDNPGGPLDWVSESFPKSAAPVVKGGVLACRAMLVRNYYEEAFAGGSLAKTSDGDEIQMVILTYAHLGNGMTVQEGMTLDGIISPSGYGEGYAAADRYRCMGRPMFRGYSRAVPDPAAVTLAVYPETLRGT